MSAGIFFCCAHKACATAFCLCGQVPVYLCETCLPNHQDENGHENFPMTSYGLYRALGYNKVELKKRIETVNNCIQFLDSVSAQEKEVFTEAENLLFEMVQCYKGWLDKNRRCFTSLVDQLRSEISSLKTTHEMPLSPLSQILLERNQTLGIQEEAVFCFIPEEKSLLKITQCSNKALAKPHSLQQEEYDKMIHQAFMKLPQAVQQNLTQGDEQQIIAVFQNEVRRLDIATNQWRLHCLLRQKINVDENSSSICIGSNTIFICGGNQSSICYVEKSAYMLERYGSVEELPHMGIGRNSPGLAWNSVKKAVYVFAGAGDCYPGLRSSEVLLAGKWSKLPTMEHIRWWFNPCWYSGLVYLCGGWTDSVEVYCPKDNTFTLQDFTLPESTAATTVVESGVLIVVSWSYVSQLQQGGLTSQPHHRYNPWSNCSPVVSGGLVYVIDLPETCRCINLTHGIVQREVRIN